MSLLSDGFESNWFPSALTKQIREVCRVAMSSSMTSTSSYLEYSVMDWCFVDQNKKHNVNTSDLVL